MDIAALFKRSFICGNPMKHECEENKFFSVRMSGSCCPDCNANFIKSSIKELLKHSKEYISELTYRYVECCRLLYYDIACKRIVNILENGLAENIVIINRLEQAVKFNSLTFGKGKVL